MIKPIPYGRQSISESDIEAVVEALHSDYLTQGPRINQFEVAFAQYVGAKYAVAVSNGTAALHLCAIVLGIKPEDKVITSPITFVASANCVKYLGGSVVFSDINPKTYLLDLDGVRRLLEKEPIGTYQGIIPVDFAGRVCDLEAFRELADEFGCWMLQDSCHSPGGHFLDSKKSIQKSGSGKFAELSIFSFHPVKHIAAGEGGMITTNDEVTYQRLLSLRTHGIVKSKSQFINEKGITLEPNQSEFPDWYMEMQELGFNYRLTDMQAALGLSQLSRARDGIKRRREIAQKYYEALKDAPFILGQTGIIEGHAYHLYIIEVENRIGLYKHLRKNQIFAQVHYIPAHLMPYYADEGWAIGDLPNAEKYYSRCLSLPMFPTLTEKEQQYVIQTIFHFYNN